MTTWLHEERLRVVHELVRECKPLRVLDLGCGNGDLFVRLANDPGIEILVGVDHYPVAIEQLRRRLSTFEARAQRIELLQASIIDIPCSFAGFDCAVLVETIEHIDPSRLSQFERTLFHALKPRHVIMTTPNAEFNTLLGVPPHRFRHPDHQFEWSRSQFRRWSQRAAKDASYTVRFEDLAGCHPEFGGASQMAVFERKDA